MKRRLALTFAGSAAIVLTAGSAAVAANLGILSSASSPAVGQLDAKTASELSTPATSLDPIVITQDEIIEVPVEETTIAPGPAPAPAPESDDAPAVSGSKPGPSSSSGPGSGGVSPTTAPRVDNSGPGSNDDHGGSDDGHSGSGSSGSGGSGSGGSDDD